MGRLPWFASLFAPDINCACKTGAAEFFAPNDDFRFPESGKRTPYSLGPFHGSPRDRVFPNKVQRASDRHQQRS